MSQQDDVGLRGEQYTLKTLIEPWTQAWEAGMAGTPADNRYYLNISLL
jgi:hypothetical protein